MTEKKPKITCCCLFPNGEDRFTTANTFGRTPLAEAAIRNKIELVRTILDDGGKNSLNMGNKAGETPLFLAVTAGHCKVAAELLLYGADPNIGTSEPCFGHGKQMVWKMSTPIWAAAHISPRKKKVKLIKLLQKYGATMQEPSMKPHWMLF
jgi:ankyrin repeat protein